MEFREIATVIPFYDVFMSYAHEDEATAETFTDHLNDSEFDVFFAKRSVAFGENIHRAVQEGLERARRIMFLVSRNSIGSLWTEFETTYDWDEVYLWGSGKLIPILLDDVELPKRLAALKHIDFREERDLSLLCDALRAAEVTCPPTLIQDPRDWKSEFYSFVARKARAHFSYSPKELRDLRTAFDELIHNAFEHPSSPKGEVKVAFKLTSTATTLSVIDNGQGFDLSQAIALASSVSHDNDNLCVRGRGLLTTSRLCVYLSNEVSEAGHIVTAIVPRRGIRPYRSRTLTELEESDHPISWYLSDGTPIIYSRILGEISMMNSQLVRHTLLEFSGYGVRGHLCDLSGVEYIDSSGLSLMVEYFSCIRAAGTGLLVLIPSDAVLRIFELSRLDRLFLLASSLAEAREIVLRSASNDQFNET